MKSAVQYIIFFGALFLLSSSLIVGLLFLKPDLFSGSNTETQSSAAGTGSATVQGTPVRSIAGPTLAELIGPETSAVAARDSVVQLQDSLHVLASLLQQERKKSDELGRPKPVQQDSVKPGIDSTKIKQRKTMAKVLESMPAENAARILQDLPEAEMKELLMNVKKRQAAKILSAIEPSRASKLFR